MKESIIDHKELKRIFNDYKHNYLLEGHSTAIPLMDFNNFKYAAWCIQNNKSIIVQNDSELLSCPFCGEIPERVEYEHRPYVHCRNTDCAIYGTPVREYQWNKRIKK